MNTHGGSEHGDLACAADQRSDISEFTDQCRSLLIFVHFFSRYRRHGDLQSWIEKEVAGDGWRI